MDNDFLGEDIGLLLLQEPFFQYRGQEFTQ
jgi:hypothetical protein